MGHPLGSHLDALDGTVFVIEKPVDAHCAAETATVGVDTSVVIDEIRLSLKVDDA